MKNNKIPRNIQNKKITKPNSIITNISQQSVGVSQNDNSGSKISDIDKIIFDN